MNRPELPRTLQSLGALRNLNLLSVGFALASLTAAIPAALAHQGSSVYSLAMIVGLPTLLCGVVWARVLRIRTKIGQTRFRLSWLASIPLAALNAGLACAALFMFDTDGMNEMARAGVLGFLLGISFGAFIWIPALVATLLLFGLPIARSHALAEKGLAGEEQGERFLGITTLILSFFGILLTATTASMPNSTHPVMDLVGKLGMWGLGLGGVLTGSLAAYFSQLRTKRRHAFVADVEAGNVTGFRVAETPEGRVLMRVTSMGEGYRVANFEEPVIEDSPLSDAPERLALRR